MIKNMQYKEKKARLIANIYHKGQMYGKHAYIKHLEDVVNVLKRYNVQDQNLLAAAWLHDILEDTNIPPSRLKRLFGNKVSKLVNAVTNEPGTNRKERNMKTYPKILAEPGAVVLKLADRIANVECSLIESENQKFLMYQKEYFVFKDALKKTTKESIENTMWEDLEYLILYNIRR